MSTDDDMVHSDEKLSEESTGHGIGPVDDTSPGAPIKREETTVSVSERNPDEDIDPKLQIDLLLNEGEECSRNDDVKGALAAFNKAIALDPGCDMAWFNRGVLLEAQQDARGARQSFQICLDLNPDHAPATANMAILLERIGDLEGAFDMGQKALNFFPGHPALVELLARCKDSGISIALDNMNASIKATQSVDMAIVEEVATQAGIENPEDLLNEAVHHDHDDDNQLSVEELQSAAQVVVAVQEAKKSTTIESEPNQPSSSPASNVEAIDIDSLVEEATESLKIGDAKKALSLLKPHLKTVGARHAGAWRIAGGAMARIPDLDNHAIAAMRHAQNLEPTHASGWFNLGSVLQRSGDQTAAIEAYQKAMEIQIPYVKAAEKLNALSLEAGLIEPYLSSAEYLLEDQPQHPVRAPFVQMLLQLAQGEQNVMEFVSGLPPTLPAGPDMALLALKYIPEGENPERAEALSLSNQHSESVLMWKTCIQQDNENPSHWSGLARSLERAGDLETAQKCHQKVQMLVGQSSHQPQITENEEHEVQGIESNEPLFHEPESTFEPDNLLTDELEQTSVNEQPIEQSLPYEIEAIGNTEHLIEGSPSEEILLQPNNSLPEKHETIQELNPEVDLAKAALDATLHMQNSVVQSTTSHSISNQEVAWFNQGVQLIDDGKYREALSSFDKALPAFANDDDMIIRILNNRGNAYYFLEEYPKCVESYHQAMMIRPSEVQGKTLYNMGTAYAEMERYPDAIKCFEQAIPRGLSDDEIKRSKDQIRRCTILQKAVEKKRKKHG